MHANPNYARVFRTEPLIFDVLFRNEYIDQISGIRIISLGVAKLLEKGISWERAIQHLEAGTRYIDIHTLVQKRQLVHSL